MRRFLRVTGVQSVTLGDFAIELLVVDIPDHVKAAVRAAQAQQFR
jgi:hypothetical protein